MAVPPVRVRGPRRAPGYRRRCGAVVAEGKGLGTDVAGVVGAAAATRGAGAVGPAVARVQVTAGETGKRVASAPGDRHRRPIPAVRVRRTVRRRGDRRRGAVVLECEGRRADVAGLVRAGACSGG